MNVGRDTLDIIIKMDMSNKTCQFIVESATRQHIDASLDVATTALIALASLELDKHSIISRAVGTKQNEWDNLTVWSDLTEYEH